MHCSLQFSVKRLYHKRKMLKKYVTKPKPSKKCYPKKQNKKKDNLYCKTYNFLRSESYICVIKYKLIIRNIKLLLDLVLSKRIKF